jgi:hypothetical protein
MRLCHFPYGDVVLEAEQCKHGMRGYALLQIKPPARSNLTMVTGRIIPVFPVYVLYLGLYHTRVLRPMASGELGAASDVCGFAIQSVIPLHDFLEQI